ncbi:hypothetical protein B0T20DRAFT_487970 [Sordaria brevicollis]|uniref:HMG box domain-containing protein n=1 Tax=Sordaria brevicollis TaxID=83679 RepID=A0AAE0P2Y1_SORBR|nr:hypothetical protein B0T20DRAFT_487970 [Sordaria brevicollis]
MTDIGGGLGLVTSSITSSSHTHSSSSRHQSQNQQNQQQQHSLRTRRSTTSSPLSTSHHSSTSTTSSTTNSKTAATTKGRITRAAAAAAAAVAKAAEAAEETDKDKEKKKTGKMASTIVAAATAPSSSSSRHSSNSTTPTSPVSHHHHHHQPQQPRSSNPNYLQPPPTPHSHLTERYPHTRSSQHQSHPSSYTDSSLAVQHPSASSTSTSTGDSTRLKGPLTRKRAASLITSELGDRTKRLSIDLDAVRSGTSKTGASRAKETGGASTSPEDTSGGNVGGGPPPQRDLICLCTPAPKVPRPRNAFILYRQHHQARVVAENPGLANPEISKIIGEKWRAESDQHKEEWKQLAEEEKLHHQRKYPEYKYQPRRGNKNSAVPGGIGSARTSPTTPGAGPAGLGGLGSAGGLGQGEHPGRCPNCGGRYIATPRTPSTPFGAASGPSGSSKSAMHAGEGRGGGQSAFSAGMDTPRGMEHHASSSRSQQHYGQQQHGGYRDHRASVSSQGGYQGYPSRDYHHSQTYHYPTPSHHQSYPAHPLYDMPQEYDVSTPTGTSSKRRRYDSTSMPPYRPEREYALPSPTTPYGHGSSSRHPSISGQYAVRPPSHYHQQQNPMSPTPMGHGHSLGHGHGQPMHHYPPPPPPPSAALSSAAGGTGSVPPTPGFAPAPSGPPTSTAALSGPASLAPSGRQRSPLSSSMAPPPRPPTLSVPASASGSYHHGQAPPSGRGSGLSPVRMRGDDSVFDPSLRLPPLQTHLAHLPPNSPESGPSSGSGVGPGLLSAGAGGDRSIGLGIYSAHGEHHHRDPRSASSGGSHPYSRLTGTGTAGNTPTASSFPANYHQGAHPHHSSQPPTSVNPSWTTHAQHSQQPPRVDPSLTTGTGAKDGRDPKPTTTITTLPHHHHNPPQTTSSDSAITSTSTTHPHPQTQTQTQTQQSKKQLAILEAQQRQQSVEAMVMSIDYVRKASVLRRIGRELPAYGEVVDHLDSLSETGDDAGNGQEQGQVQGGEQGQGQDQQVMTTRGPIVAVEGPDKRLLRFVGRVVERVLVELGDCEVRCWVGEGDHWKKQDDDSEDKKKKEEGEGKKGEDVEMADTIVARGSSPRSNDGKERSISHSPSRTIPSSKNPFPRYLDLMLSWHQKAAELTRFVTTPFYSSSMSPSRSSSPLPSTGNPLPPASSLHPSLQTSQNPSIHPSTDPSRQNSRHPSHSPSISTSATGQKLPKLPIALLPLGYSLTYSDRFACSIPIADAYAPVDHWQWMATLWRGIVGPDLTVYVQPVTEQEMALEGGGRGGMRGQAEVEVEVKGERLVAVRVVVPSGRSRQGGGQGGFEGRDEVKLGEEAERKLAFLVGEWVRAGQFGVQGRGGVAGQRGVGGGAQVGYEAGRGHGLVGHGDGW